MIFFKYVASRNIRHVRNSFLSNNYSKGAKLFSSFHANTNLYGSSTNLSSLPGYHIMRLYAQIVWKRLFWIRSSSVLTFSATTMIAGATGLALMNSHPSALGICRFMTNDLPRRKALEGAPAAYFGSHRPDTLASSTSSTVTFVLRFRLFMRAMYLAVLFSPTIMMAALVEFCGVGSRKTCLHLLVVALERAGPAFRRWAQWAATRPDLFPRDLCIALSKIQSQAPVHSFSDTKRIIEKVFCRKLSEIFYDFEEVPMASGCVSQVHRATLRSQYPGKQSGPIAVAVKVRHPSIKESFKLDYAIIECVANILRSNSKFEWLKFDVSLQEMSGPMKSEVDLSTRAALLARVGTISQSWNDFSFPKPLYPLVHPAVLVETYESGERLSHYVGKDSTLKWDTKEAVLTTGTQTFRTMMMANLVFDGMHPQNILVRLEKGKPHLIFLDVGTLAELSNSEVLDSYRLFTAFAHQEGHTAAKCALRFSKKQTCLNPDDFVEDVEDLFNTCDSYINSYKCMLRFLEIANHREVSFDENVRTVFRSLLALEDWQRKFCSEGSFKIMQSYRRPKPYKPNTTLPLRY